MALSALQSFDLLEKSYLHEGVSPPSRDEHTMVWVGTSLSIAGVPLLVGEGELEEIMETPECTAIPGTKPWVMGVAAHKGGLLPIINGDALFGDASYSGRMRDYCMVVRRSGFHFGITLSGIERDLKFPIEERDMDHPVDPDFADLCLGGFHHGEKFLAVLDIDKLVADSNLSNASATGRDSNEGKTDGK